MVKLVKIISNSGATKSTTYLGDDGNTYVLTGDLGARANNPGNISPAGATRSIYESQFGAIGYLPSSPGQPAVAVFPDLASGQTAQLYLWQTSAYQNKTIDQAAQSWAALPYAGALRDAAGVPGDTKVSDLTTTQLQAMIGAQNGREGSSNLRITDGQGNAVSPQVAASFVGGASPVEANSSGSPDDRSLAAYDHIQSPVPRAAIPLSLADAPLPAPAPLTAPPPATVSAKFNDIDEVASPFAAPPRPVEAQHLVNLNGKMVPVGTYPSPSNPGSTVTVTDDGNGKAVVKVTDPGFAGGIKPGTIAGSIVGKAVADAAAQAAAAAPQVLDNVGNAANAAKDQIGNLGTGLVNGAGSLLSGLFGGGSKAPAVPAPTSDYTQTANGNGAKALDTDGTPVDGFTVTHTGWDNGRPVMEVDGSPVIVRASIPDATVALTAPRMLNPTMFLTGADQLTFTPPKTLSEALAGTSYADMGPALDMHFAKTAPTVDIADAHDRAMIAAAPKAPAPSTATVKPQGGITKITTQGVQPAGTVQMPADVHPRVGNKGGYEDLGPGLPSFDEFSKSMGITAAAPVPAKLTPAPQRPAAVVPPAVTTVTETKINPEYTAWQAQYGGLSTGTKATTVSAKFNDTDVGTVSAKFNDRDGTAPPVVAAAPVAPPPPKKYITITKKVAAPPIGTPPVSNPRPVAPPVDTGPAYITAQGNLNRQQTHDALIAQQGKNMSGLITTPGSNKGYTVDKSGSSYESALQPG